VVDGIDVFTRLTRDIIYAFTALHTPESFQHAFPDPAHA
jgi:hypothetical protein